jgi:hypothetical protein
MATMLDIAQQSAVKSSTQVEIRDFRCFHRVSSIPIRPINILVGENSTGKSSFLAAMRFLLELPRRDAKASFNKDPFFLGSYEQIAHYRGGRFGRAKTFSFTLRGEIDKDYVLRRARPLFRNAEQSSSMRLPDNFQLQVHFHNNRSQPAICRVEFEAGNFYFLLTAEKEINLAVRTPNIQAQYPSERVASGYDPFSYDLSDLDFMLRDARYSLSRGKNSKLIRDELQVLSDLYRFAMRVLPRQVYASAPVRSKPERTYNPGESSPSPSGQHIPFVLAQIKAFDKDLWAQIARNLGEFGKSSGLFDAISIKQLSRAEGGPFQLIVNLNGANSNIIDVGYGVSQILPIITDLVRAQVPTCFLFQQPEVHLHPKAQAELATFFAQVALAQGHTLFLETHSDYIIDRIRMEVRESRYIRPEDVSILYFERSRHDIDVHVISVDKQGNIRGAPKGYRSFFIEEEFRSLGTKL